MKARKNLRLPDYDYGQNGCYFITMCTQGRIMPFGFLPVVGAAPCDRPNAATEMAEHWLLKLEEKFPCVTIDKYVIMPNHIHAMISIESQGGHMGPPLPKIMDWYKTMTTNEYIRLVHTGCAMPFQGRLWQRSYYDHVIRSHDDYLQIWNYIESNPAKWSEDIYYDGKAQCRSLQKKVEDHL